MTPRIWVLVNINASAQIANCATGLPDWVSVIYNPVDCISGLFYSSARQVRPQSVPMNLDTILLICATITSICASLLLRHLLRNPTQIITPEQKATEPEAGLENGLDGNGNQRLD